MTQVFMTRYLKKLLKQRYGKHIYFASRPGRDDVIGFTGFCDFLVLHDKYFTEKNEGCGSEAEIVVQKATGLILAEMRQMSYSREYCPSPDDTKSSLPPLLNILLQHLIRSSIKATCIGQCLVQCRLRTHKLVSCHCRLQLALSLIDVNARNCTCILQS